MKGPGVQHGISADCRNGFRVPYNTSNAVGIFEPKRQRRCLTAQIDLYRNEQSSGGILRVRTNGEH
jgi:hypothetical protein